jgi:membrane protein YqaA with SNARE-associated domain
VIVRLSHVLVATTVVASLAPREVAAQAVQPVLGAVRVPSGSSQWQRLGGASDAALRGTLFPPDENDDIRRVITTSASVVAGAALGAWLGYFVSQLVKSDWEGETTGERAGHRRSFAISGAAIGALTGYLIRPRARRIRSEPPGRYIYVAPSPRHYITRQELRRTLALSALEAVQLLRPEWLVPSPIPGAAADNETATAVYVVDTRVGGPEALADVTILEVEELRRYEAREAARRWGVTLPFGAIEVVPAASRTAK